METKRVAIKMTYFICFSVYIKDDDVAGFLLHSLIFIVLEPEGAVIKALQCDS